MKKPAVVTITLTLLPLLAGNVLADDAPPLILGSRIRVTADRRIVGKLLARDDQTLTLDLGDAKDPVEVPRAAIIRVEQSVRPSRRGQEALGGAAAGAFAGLALGALRGSSARASLLGYPPGEHREWSGPSPLAFFLVYGLVLVPAGAIVGALSGGERWKKVPLDRIKVGLAPTRGRGIAGGVSVSF